MFSVCKEDVREINTDIKANANEKWRSVLALEETPEGVLHLVSHTTCLNKLQELRFNVASATDLSQHGSSFIQSTTLHQTVWGVDHQEGPQCEEQWWHTS